MRKALVFIPGDFVFIGEWKRISSREYVNLAGCTFIRWYFSDSSIITTRNSLFSYKQFHFIE